MSECSSNLYIGNKTWRKRLRHGCFIWLSCKRLVEEIPGSCLPPLRQTCKLFVGILFCTMDTILTATYVALSRLHSEDHGLSMFLDTVGCTADRCCTCLSQGGRLTGLLTNANSIPNKRLVSGPMGLKIGVYLLYS